MTTTITVSFCLCNGGLYYLIVLNVKLIMSQWEPCMNNVLRYVFVSVFKLSVKVEKTGKLLGINSMDASGCEVR